MRTQRPQTPRRGRRVYEYIRVSTAREEMISPEVQHQHNVQAAAREGLEIVDTIYDLDLSGRDFAKRKVGHMIRGIEQGDADGVLVWKVSRWGRNLLDSLLNINELQKLRGFIVSSTENLGDIESPMGRFSLAQLLLIAQLQSDQLKEGWMDAQWNRISNGLPGNGKPRFGYVYNKEAREYTQDPVIAPWLRKAYVNYINGTPLSRVVTEMREAGIRGTGGKPIVHSALLFILDSGFGAGLIITNARRGRAKTEQPTYYPGKHESVISGEEWQRYLTRRKGNHAPRHENVVSRISVVTRCGTCGRTLQRYKDDGHPSWGCRNTPFNSTTPCSARASMREHKIEAEVYRWLTEQAQSDGYDEAAARLAAASAAQVDLGRLQIEAVELEEALLRLDDQLLRGRIPEGRADKLRQRYEMELMDNRQNQQAMKRHSVAPDVPTPEMFEGLAELWLCDDIDPNIVNASLRKVVKSIRVFPRTEICRINIIPAWKSGGDDVQAASA